jgi:hypothetical protein
MDCAHIRVSFHADELRFGMRLLPQTVIHFGLLTARSVALNVKFSESIPLVVSNLAGILWFSKEEKGADLQVTPNIPFYLPSQRYLASSICEKCFFTPDPGPHLFNFLRSCSYDHAIPSQNKGFCPFTRVLLSNNAALPILCFILVRFQHVDNLGREVIFSS